MLSKFTTNAPMKVLSLLIAIVLWFVVLGSRNVEITKDIPLELITPPDLIISNEVPDRVSFRIAGPKAFLRNILNRKEQPIRVNLSNAKAGAVTYRFFSDNIQVPIGVKVLFINPTSMVVKLEAMKTRDVPLRMVTKGAAASGYRISSLSLSSATVKIKGPESKVDGISEITTNPIELASLRESGSRDTPIDLSRFSGVVVDGEPPKYKVDVVQETANFRLKAIRIKVLTDKRFAAQPKEVNVYVACSANELKKLVKSKVVAIADLRGNGPGVYDASLSVELPPTVRFVKVVPQKVRITLF